MNQRQLKNELSFAAYLKQIFEVVTGLQLARQAIANLISNGSSENFEAISVKINKRYQIESSLFKFS